MKKCVALVFVALGALRMWGRSKLEALRSNLRGHSIWFEIKIKTHPVSLGWKNEKLESVGGTFLIFREPRVAKATTFICQKRNLTSILVAIAIRKILRSALVLPHANAVNVPLLLSWLRS